MRPCAHTLCARMERTGSAWKLIITHNDRSIKSDHLGRGRSGGTVKVYWSRLPSIARAMATITLSTDLAMPRLNEAFTLAVGLSLLWDQHFHRAAPRWAYEGQPSLAYNRSLNAYVPLPRPNSGPLCSSYYPPGQLSSSRLVNYSTRLIEFWSKNII